MLSVISSNKFKKDLKLAIKRGFNIELLREVVNILVNQENLEDKYCDHSLSGEYGGFRECHIEPDWLLVYKIDNKDLELFLFRTGTHSDLFK